LIHTIFNIRNIIAFFAIIVFSAIAVGQNNFTSSPYSRYGIGEISSRGFCQNDALGGLGIGLRNNKSLNIMNPASYSSIDTLTFIFEFGVRNKSVYVQSSDVSELMHNTNISYLSFGFPLTKWWYGSIGLIPLSSVGYNLKEEIESATLPREIFYTGSGGINKFYFGNSFKLHKTFSIGVNASYMFGTIEQMKTLKFTDTSYLYMNLRTQNNITISDFYYNLGLQYTNKMMGKYEYTLGAVFDNKHNISATRNTLATNFYNKGGSSLVDTIINTPDEKGKIALPMNFGVGYTIKGDKWMFGTDYYFQNWESFRLFGMNDSLANSHTVSAGAEYTPEKSSMSNFWKRVTYRFGSHYSKSFLRFSEKNEQLNDVGISFGIAMPVKKSRSILNLSLELGSRGTTNKNLIRETYMNIGINFSLSDSWFHKYKFD